MTNTISNLIFERVMKGQNYQVLQISHSWLKVFAQNYEGHAALLIRASLPDDQIVHDGRGYNVKFERTGENSYIRITSELPGFSELFLILVQYVFQRTNQAHSESSSIASLTEALTEIKKFFGRRSGRLSFEQVQGLFAELYLMQIWLEQGFSARSLLSAWKGPYSKDGIGLHDFTFSSGRGIEVKSTHQPATEIRISSPDQLTVSAEQLDLMVLPVETVPVGIPQGKTIRKLIAECMEVLGQDQDAQFSFVKALERFGVDFTDEFYDQWRFVPGNWQRYKIVEGFPQIDLNQIPKGISKISFSIVLNEIKDFAASVEELLIMGVEE